MSDNRLVPAALFGGLLAGRSVWPLVALILRPTSLLPVTGPVLVEISMANLPLSFQNIIQMKSHGDSLVPESLLAIADREAFPGIGRYSWHL